MATRDVNDLHPVVRIKANKLRAACLLLGVDLFFPEVLRTPEEQGALYAKGRTTEGRIVTHAKAWQSWHQPHVYVLDEVRYCCLAFDVAGRPADNPQGATWDLPWEMIGLMGEQLGLEWGGRWKKPKTDRPHFHDPLGKTLAWYAKHREEMREEALGGGRFEAGEEDVAP
jgi:peptidoglycan L-alanyl-D-glutamate endopeptidase CwlK